MEYLREIRRWKEGEKIEWFAVLGFTYASFWWWHSLLHKYFLTCHCGSDLFGLGVGVLVTFFFNSVLLKPIDKHVTILMNGEYQVLVYCKIMRNPALACTFLTLFKIVVFFVLWEKFQRLNLNRTIRLCWIARMWWKEYLSSLS